MYVQDHIYVQSHMCSFSTLLFETQTYGIHRAAFGQRAPYIYIQSYTCMCVQLYVYTIQNTLIIHKHIHVQNM